MNGNSGSPCLFETRELKMFAFRNIAQSLFASFIRIYKIKSFPASLRLPIKFLLYINLFLHLLRCFVTVACIGVARIFDWGGPNHKSHAMMSSEIFKKRSFCGAKILLNGRSEAVDPWHLTRILVQGKDENQ